MSTEAELVADYLPQLNEAVAQLITRPEIHSLVASLKTLLPQTSEPFVWSTPRSAIDHVAASRQNQVVLDLRAEKGRAVRLSLPSEQHPTW